MSLVESWHRPTTFEVALLAVCAAVVLIGFYFVIVAVRTGETAAVSPFRYSYMLFAMASSLLVFSERPDMTSWLGIGMIVAAGLYMVHREHVAGRRTERTPAEPRRIAA
jgi:drug/metabolite transporter (DMT)-like permease